MDSLSANRQPRRWTGLALVGLVPLGLYTKVYAGPAAAWVNNSLGGVFYVLFGCLMVFWLLPRVSPWRIALAVLAVTGLLEFLQRWHPAWLEWLRSFWIGQILLGTTFAGSNFPDYVIDAWLPGRGRRNAPLLPDLYFPFSKSIPITAARSRVKPLKKLKRRIPAAG